MDRDSGLTAQLAPLEAALMDAARHDAAARVADAEASAKAAIDAGATKAKSILAQADADGRRAAERASARRLVEGRQRARSLVLGAQRRVYERLLAQSVESARTLHRSPQYAALEGRLVDQAKALLGADARIEDNPDDQGGIRASSDHRVVDLTLDTLARRGVAGLGQEIAQLWA